MLTAGFVDTTAKVDRGRVWVVYIGVSDVGVVVASVGGWGMRLVGDRIVMGREGGGGGKLLARCTRNVHR